VKLLLDESVSRRIVPALQEGLPGSTQVALIGLQRADDHRMWEYAGEHGYVIVTKDDDFVRLQSLLGYPPKVILLNLGNCTSQQVLATLVSLQRDIQAVFMQEEVGLVEVY
jgi:predicted nuclease of predicted toxin-antitoxin system